LRVLSQQKQGLLPESQITQSLLFHHFLSNVLNVMSHQQHGITFRS
jgi:hypothetical protein